MSIVEKSISSKGIEIDKNLDIDSYIVGIDSELQQVIINIVTNSKDILVEKMIKEPIIKIATSKEHRKAIITIEDNGGGIPNNIIDKVFDSYFTTKGEGGTGIGLNLSKMIVEEGMHGKISVYNSDIGAVFKIAIDTVEIN
jgi:C4-dicarboxylate-specific signal transduction histidine kinase